MFLKIDTPYVLLSYTTLAKRRRWISTHLVPLTLLCSHQAITQRYAWFSVLRFATDSPRHPRTTQLNPAARIVQSRPSTVVLSKSPNIIGPIKWYGRCPEELLHEDQPSSTIFHIRINRVVFHADDVRGYIEVPEAVEIRCHIWLWEFWITSIHLQVVGFWLPEAPCRPQRVGLVARN